MKIIAVIRKIYASIWKTSCFEENARGFCVGLVFAIPFLCFQMPGLWGYAPFLLGIPLGIHVFKFGVRLSRRIFGSTTLRILMAVVLVNVIGLIVGDETIFRRQTIIELIVAVVLIAAFVSLGFTNSRHQVFPSFLKAIFSGAVVMALLGLGKHFLYMNGFLLSFFMEKCGSYYPQGAAMCGDYNLFGLLLFAAAVAGILGISRSSSWVVTALLICALTVILTAGLFSGSRRFLLLFPFILFFFAWFIWKCKDLKTFCYVAIVPFFVPLFLFLLPMTPPSVENQPFIVLSWRELASFAGFGGFNQFAPRQVDSWSMATTFMDGAFGAGSRLERWALGFDLIREHWLFGMGFNYHQIFSCQFSECKFLDYPHLTIVSSWLVAGVFGLIVSLLFYLHFVRKIFSFRTAGWLSGLSFLTLAILPYSLLSGDTILAIPHIVVAYLMLDDYGLQFRPVE